MKPNLIERLSEHYSFSLLIKASNDLGLCVLVSVSLYHIVNIPIIGGSLGKFCVCFIYTNGKEKLMNFANAQSFNMKTWKIQFFLETQNA